MERAFEGVGGASWDGVASGRGGRDLGRGKLLGELLEGGKALELIVKVLDGGSQRGGVASARGGRGIGIEKGGRVFGQAFG